MKNLRLPLGGVMTEQTAHKLETIRSYAQFCVGDGYPAYPLEIFLEVSNVCNLKCAMCWQFSALNTNRFKQLKSQDRGFLETGVISANLDTILNGALLVHCFGFGEPTMHPEFRSIVEQVTRHGAMSDFYTNGMHLDQELCDFLVDMKVLQIIVSFSGITKEFYENVYIGGDFDRVLGGIKRLADTKKKKHSSYPVIHINSIGFKDHVASFDDFTLMMARTGANFVILSHLSVHQHIPYLHEHVSNLRPDEEGVVLARAKAIGAALGVTINAAGYEKHTVATQADYQARRSGLRRSVEPILAAGGRAFGDNPVQTFQQIARGLPIAREASQEKRLPPVSLPLDADRKAVRAAFNIAQCDAAGSANDLFYCMEPFKTLYVTRNGAVKPCSEASTDIFLGNLDSHEAADIWRGTGYDEVRRGIAQGEYPTFCVGCLKNKSAPEYYISSLVDRYLDWNETNFGPDLRTALLQHAPDAQHVIRTTPPAMLMAAARARLQEHAGCISMESPSTPVWSVDDGIWPEGWDAGGAGGEPELAAPRQAR
jgi:MoaA/NifB/PqqE/SkfB family radical SAM enzyme